MREGQIVWARDIRHSHYEKWGRGLFLKKEEKDGNMGYLIEHFTEDNAPSGVCRWYPEVRASVPLLEEQLERRNL